MGNQLSFGLLSANVGIDVNVDTAPIGDGIIKGSENLSKQIAATTGAAREEMAAMRSTLLRSTGQLSETALRCTDLATKQVALAVMQSTASICQATNRAVQDFNAHNRVLLDQFVQGMDHITRYRVDQLHAAVAQELSKLLNANAEWQRIAREARLLPFEERKKKLTLTRQDQRCNERGWAALLFMVSSSFWPPLSMLSSPVLTRAFSYPPACMS